VPADTWISCCNQAERSSQTAAKTTRNINDLIYPNFSRSVTGLEVINYRLPCGTQSVTHTHTQHTHTQTQKLFGWVLSFSFLLVEVSFHSPSSIFFSFFRRYSLV
jgi:hypothetical protein